MPAGPGPIPCDAHRRRDVLCPADPSRQRPPTPQDTPTRPSRDHRHPVDLLHLRRVGRNACRSQDACALRRPRLQRPRVCHQPAGQHALGHRRPHLQGPRHRKDRYSTRRCRGHPGRQKRLHRRQRFGPGSGARHPQQQNHHDRVGGEEPHGCQHHARRQIALRRQRRLEHRLGDRHRNQPDHRAHPGRQIPGERGLQP